MTSPSNDVLVSVVTVCKDDLCNLKRTVVSVLPHLKDFELIVKDGSSSNDTVVWLSTISNPRIKSMAQPDRGIYDAMNQALNQCCGEYVWFVNAGDILVAEGVGHLIKVLRKNKSPIIKCLVETEGKIVRKERASVLYITRRMLNHQGLLYKKEVLLSNQYDPSLKVAGDFKQLIEYNLWLSVFYFDECCVQYLGGGVATRPSSILKNWEERLTVWRWKQVKFRFRVAIFLTAIIGRLFWRAKLMSIRAKGRIF